MNTLQTIARETGLGLDDAAFAAAMDARDPLRGMRDEFAMPTVAQVTADDSGDSGDGGSAGDGEPCTYLCGNSLGLMPLAARRAVDEEMDMWAQRGVVGHHRHAQGRAWIAYRTRVAELMAPLVGAQADEVGVMNTLTVNVHLMLAAFYRPQGRRTRILIEARAFPSDHYAAESQVRWHGGDPAADVMLATPRPGEDTLRTDDVLQLLADHGDTIAVVMLSGVQYYTGQAFDMPRITAAAQAQGCVVGWDLAHAAGNLELALHDWGVDFACWCTYKYINSGPGGIGAFFVHSRHHDAGAAAADRRLTGWWGHRAETRFQMTNRFEPAVGAAAFEVSNTPILPAAALLGSLEVFARAGGMGPLRAKSELLTAYLEHLLHERVGAKRMRIITPSDPTQRGAQLSVVFSEADFARVFAALSAAGVVCDERKPNCIRIAPAPLYNTFADVWRCVEVIRDVL
ncbi:Kynureninase (L-kynurenine hydrolase) [Coemansia erecta]|uniref:Kynureninase n=1 Tax=Coemansia erecta TaxID=147472 RepID=A0A9W7Y0K7_9FUNG|nr:Kynureninase (L-kynurenine hydrolase) [Coemansia erecta]